MVDSGRGRGWIASEQLLVEFPEVGMTVGAVLQGLVEVGGEVLV